MTAPNRNDGRYWLWFVGSAPPSRPVAKPIEKPPSVAGIGRFMPPSTTPASTTIVSRSAKSGVTSGFWTVRITATTAASAPESSTATPITRFARTPSMRAVWKSIAAARICRPIVVRSSRSESEQADHRDDDGDDRDLPDVDAPDRDRAVEVGERRRDLAERAEPEQRDALEQERHGERRDEHHRRRVAAQGPEDEPVHEHGQDEHGGEAEDDAGPHRPAPLRRERQRERARHDELAVGEVDEAQDAEDEPDADRHQRVDRAERIASASVCQSMLRKASVMRSTPRRGRRCRPRSPGRA